ncbi:hypothetical protein CFP56_039362 [Quercus suber]|uniref:Uncharacterized protein n=1 Tax=Quercus suber TaxID=58331 RepID=A0AAW0LPC0_QUESU
MKSSDAFEELSFNQTSFWEVHDLPVRRSSLEVAMEIVSVMGKVDVRMSKEGGSSNFNFFRTRVNMDITKPLCRGHRITMASGKEGWRMSNVGKEQRDFEGERLAIWGKVACYYTKYVLENGDLSGGNR